MWVEYLTVLLWRRPLKHPQSVDMVSYIMGKTTIIADTTLRARFTVIGAHNLRTLS